MNSSVKFKRLSKMIMLLTKQAQEELTDSVVSSNTHLRIIANSTAKNKTRVINFTQRVGRQTA